MSDGAPARSIGGDGQQPLTAAAVAALTGGEVHGNDAVELLGIAPLDRAGPNDLSFLAHARYGAWFATTRAGAVFVSPQLQSLKSEAQCTIVVPDPAGAMVQLLAHFYQAPPRQTGIHSSAVIAASARLGEGVTIEPFVVIGEDAVVGDGCWLGAGSNVGASSVLGKDVRLFPSATVYPRTEIGDRVIIHAGAQVGREGFGFVTRDSGVLRIPHVGRCVLEQDVEVGANSCIDRGSVDDTVIGAGTKIDNLVQVGHNVRIGRMCFIASQAGIAGSARIGDGVQVGGQAGIGGHMTVGARAIVAARGGIIGDVPPGETWSGYPARPHKEQMRAYAALNRLAGMIKPLEKLLSSKESE